MCGGRTQTERRAAFRAYTEQPLRQGAIERPWDRLLAGLVLGTEAFARGLRRQIRGNRREQAALKQLAPAVSWEQIVGVVEEGKHEPWNDFAQRHGDWGRDAAMWLGRRHARLSLAQLGRLAGGVDYAAVGQALSRFNRRLQQDRALGRQVAQIEHELSKIEM
ncbi:MAG TPA: hypothetical protein VG146_21305 [Verrucomicrobiae bacterium]|nr:hypothetical protein [Verrucomicrobiae bacterium]